MNPNRVAVAALGFTCVAAAAGGGYLASRQHAAVQPAEAATVAATTPPAEAQKAAVSETEAIVGDIKPATAVPPRTAPERPAPARTASASPRPARRAETSSARTTAPASGSAWPVSVPSGFPSDSSPSQPVSESNTVPAPVADNQPAEPARVPDPPKAPEKEFAELVVSSNSVIGLQLDGAISSDRANLEDRVDARVVRDVRVGNEVAIPAGARALGSVTVVERGGKFKDRARLGIRFHTLVLADGTRLPITSETIYRNGDAPGNASAAKIGGGAVAGAILGAIVGGAKGAAIGAGAGAGGGTAAVMAGDAKAATFPSGTEVTARILSPVAITVEK
jgi:type IV secretory pathway VirB10-like protein